MADMSAVLGAKARKKLLASTVESASAPTSDFARRQMEKMGWTEGKGLGKAEDGIASHISVKRRDDNAGVGFDGDDPEAWGAQWWHGAYNRAARKIGGNAANDSDSDTDSSDSSDDEADSGAGGGKPAKKRGRRPRLASAELDRVPTDAELFAATGGIRLGMREHGDMTGKLMRAEVLQEGVSADSAGLAAQKEKARAGIIISAPGSKAKKAKKSKKSKKRRREEKAGAEGDPVVPGEPASKAAGDVDDKAAKKAAKAAKRAAKEAAKAAKKEAAASPAESDGSDAAKAVRKAEKKAAKAAKKAVKRARKSE